MHVLTWGYISSDACSYIGGTSGTYDDPITRRRCTSTQSASLSTVQPLHTHEVDAHARADFTCGYAYSALNSGFGGAVGTYSSHITYVTRQRCGAPTDSPHHSPFKRYTPMRWRPIAHCPTARGFTWGYISSDACSYIGGTSGTYDDPITRGRCTSTQCGRYILKSR